MAIVVGAGTALGVGGAGIWGGIFVFALLLAVGSPLWYWVGRPLYVWKFGERDAPFYRPPGTLSENRAVKYGSIGAYSLVVILLSIFIIAAATSGGPTQLELGEEVSTEKFAASVTEIETTDRIVESGLGEEEREVSPGATFVLVKFEITNIGDSQGEVPANKIISNEVNMEYNDETLDPIETDHFSAEGVSYESYQTVSEENSNTIFPGTTISGWFVFQIAEGFDREDAVVRIEIGPETQVYEWRLI